MFKTSLFLVILLFFCSCNIESGNKIPREIPNSSINFPSEKKIYNDIVEKHTEYNKDKMFRNEIIAMWKYNGEKWMEFDFSNKDIYDAVIKSLKKPYPAEKSKLEIGLYWLISNRNGKQSGMTLYNGSMKCDDIMLPPPIPKDKMPACVPYENYARAGYIPNPNIFCKIK